MRNNLLISVAAAALLAGTALASAQGVRPGGSDLPGAAPAEKMDQGGSPGLREQTKDQKGPRQGIKQNGGADQNAQTPSRSTTGQAPDRSDSMRGQATDRGDATKGQGQMDRSKDQPRAGQRDTQQPAAQGQPAQRSGQGQQQQQTGQGGQQGGASATLSTEQRTKIRSTVLSQGNAPRVSRSEINFNISIGTAVPRTVRLVALPPTVVEVYPAWSGFLFFIVGDEIVIVQPGSLRIVAVIPA
jgi:hypothetical protein